MRNFEYVEYQLQHEVYPGHFITLLASSVDAVNGGESLELKNRSRPELPADNEQESKHFMVPSQKVLYLYLDNWFFPEDVMVYFLPG